MCTSRCGEVFRGCICPRCQKTFFICRHCDRGHVYCCKECSLLSRCEKCRVYRRRYRRSDAGRKDHRDGERARRRRLILGQEIMGDQTYRGSVSSAKVSARVRMVAMSVVLERIGEEENQDEKIFCEFCGRPGRFVYFGDGTIRERRRAKMFRLPD